MLKCTPFFASTCFHSTFFTYYFIARKNIFKSAKNILNIWITHTKLPCKNLQRITTYQNRNFKNFLYLESYRKHFRFQNSPVTLSILSSYSRILLWAAAHWETSCMHKALYNTTCRYLQTAAVITNPV